jgi:P27 family predicted phage terminase small subunit
MLAADQKTKRQGAVILTGLGGAKVNPYLSVASQARAEMLKILAEFGCTPSARSRIKLDSGPSQEDELAAFVRSKPE